MNQKFLTGIETSGNLTVDSQSAVNETVFDVQGTQGQLFSVTNGLSGDLFSVSDISGIPILNVNSSGLVTIDGALDSFNVTEFIKHEGDIGTNIQFLTGQMILKNSGGKYINLHSNGIIYFDASAYTFNTGNATFAGTVTANGTVLTGDQDLSGYLLNTTDTFTGTLTLTHASFGQGLVLNRNHTSNAASIVFKNSTGQQGILYAISSDNQPYWRDGTTTNANKIWTSGNDGASSGLDADLLDGNHASAFAPSSVVNQTDFVSAASGGTFSGNVNVFPNASTGTFRVGRYAGQEFKLHATDLINTLTSINDADENQTHDFILDREHAGSGANNFKIQKDGTDQLSIDTNANATFAGTIDSGAITSTGVIKSNRAEAQFELVSTHGRTSYINQGGGNLHIKAAHASGVGINYGDTTNPGLLKLYNNTTSKVTLDATNGDATFAGDVHIGSGTPNGAIDIHASSGNWRVNNYGAMYFRNSSNATHESYIHSRADGSLSIGRVAESNWTGSGAGSYAADTYDHVKFDTSSNATFAGTIGSGAITSTGKITGTELEGTSLDINGDGAIDGKVIISDDDDGALTIRRASNTDQALYLRGGAGSGEGRVAAQYSLDLVSGLGGSNSYDLKLITNAGTALQIDASDSNKAIFSGPITSTGQITGTELEGTSLDINGNADISGNLTVNGTAQLGNALSDKAIIHGHLGIGHESYPKIAYPGQNALWGEANNSTVGQVVIDLPGTLANYDMTYMEIDIYEYNSTNATKLIIGGHNWNSNGNSGTGNLMWYNAGVTVIGSNPKSVYLGWRNDGTNNRRVIAIGEVDSTWNYPTIHVAKVHGNDGYSSAIDWVGDWAMNLTTSSSFFTKSPTTNFNTTAITTFKTRGKISASGAAFTNDVTVGGIVDLGSSSSSIKKTANTSGNHAAIELYSSGTSDTGAAIAIQQQTSEGDTIIFADYEPHVEWGISAENGANEIHFTAGSSTNSLGSKTFKSNAGNDRTAYKKMIVNLSSGNVAVGGTLTSSGKITGTELDINGSADISGALTLGTALAVAEGGTGATNLNALVQTSGNQTITGVKQFNDYINAAANIQMTGHLYNSNDSNSIDLVDHSNYTWFRNSSNRWVFQGGSGGDDWTRSFHFTLQSVGSGFNDKLLLLGQQQNNGSDGGKYKGVRIVKSTGSSSVVDGYLQAGDVVITGDLEVQGTTTTVNQTNLDVQDNIIGLNRSVASNANDSGIIIERGDVGNNAALIWDEGDDHFILGTTTADAASTGSISVTGGNLKLGGLLLDGNTITGVDDSEEFTNDDAHIMTSAAIEDKILGYNYATSGHNHDTRYLRKDVETQGTQLNLGGEISSGSSAKLQVQGFMRTGPIMIASGNTGASTFNTTSEKWLMNNSGNLYIGDGTNYSDRIFHDSYHPNADKWTTARTITLGGDLSGSVSIDGSANVTLSAQVANNSHTHDDRYYTETESNSLYTRKYDFSPGNGGSGRWFIKLFTVNDFDSSVVGKISSAGDYGDSDRATYEIQIATRNNISFDVYQLSTDAVSDDYNFYYKLVSGSYEIWLEMGDYNQTNTFTKFSQYGTVAFNFNGGTQTTPSGLTAVTKSNIYHEGHKPTLTELGFTGDSDATNDQDLSGLLPKSGGTMSNGASINFPTSAGTVRGYIQATDTNDEHFIIATSGGEDIAFKDGGLSGTTNLISRGDGDLWVRGAIQNGTIDYSQVNGTVPTWNQNTSGSSGSCTGNAATATTATTATTANAVAWGNITSRPYIVNASNNSSTATTTIAGVAHATYSAAFFDFVIKNGTNVRAGTVYACHNGDSTPLVEFAETSTVDLGDTSDVTLSVDISGTNMRLRATTTSSTWTIKTLIRAI